MTAKLFIYPIDIIQFMLWITNVIENRSVADYQRSKHVCSSYTYEPHVTYRQFLLYADSHILTATT